MKKNLLIGLIFLFTFLLFWKNALVQKAILSSCELFITKLFPSLFPMMILCDLLIFFDLPDLFCKYFGSLFSKVFHTSPNGAFAFFISCFSGTPSNAYMIKNLYLEQVLTKEEASHILSFSFFTNPLFYYTMLNAIFPRNNIIIWKLFFIPYLVNILIAILSHSKTQISKLTVPKQKPNFGIFLTNSINHTMNTLMFILGSVTLFFILNTLINPNQIPLISGVLEVSQGLHSLTTVLYSLKLKEILTIFFVSFGGLSIHLQVKGILSDTPISYQEFLKGRIKQVLFSIIFLIFV